MAELNAAVTPVGRPDALSATLLLNPPIPVTLIIAPALPPPASSVRPAGEDERLKLGAGMFRTITVELVAVPEVPVTVTRYFPGTTELLALKIRSAELAFTVEKNAATPAGTFDAVKFTLLVRPIEFVAETTIGRFHASSPTRRVKLLTEDLRVKLGDMFDVGAVLARA